jgi:hypothetical protein
MNKVFILVMGLVLGGVRSEGAVLIGQANGISMLNCMAANTTGRPQVVDQVEYDWACNYGPMNPYQPGFQVQPCFAGCKIDPGATFFHTFGPFTGNCPVLMNAFCRVYTHEVKI